MLGYAYTKTVMSLIVQPNVGQRPSRSLITPRACARGKVIGRVVVIVVFVVSRSIATSRGLVT